VIRVVEVESGMVEV
jgi:hypothetical protein